jgi:hypothetical protein
MSQPLPAIPLQYEAPTSRPTRWWLSLGRCAVVAAWPICLLAWFLLFVNVKSVVVAGPAIVLLGLVAIVGGIVHRRWWLLVIGAWHVTLCLLFLALVNLRSWSPDEAKDPFITMGLVHLILTLPLTLYVLWSPPADAMNPLLPPPRDLSADLRLLYEFELSMGNTVARIDRNLWSSFALTIVFHDPLHIPQAIERLTLSPHVGRWENRDTHYDLEAGWRCASTGHALSGPIAERGE